MKHNIAMRFWTGLAVSLVGTSLIWAGDGSATLVRKGIVVTGVALTLVGIGILRYLLIAKSIK